MKGEERVPKTKMTEVHTDPVRCLDCPIREQALFQVLSDDYLEHAEQRRSGQYLVGARAHLYLESAPATMAFTLYEGWLMLYRAHADGSRQGLRIALPGDFVGYVPASSTVYSHSALAITDVVACGFRQSDLHAMIDHRLEIARAVDGIQAHNLALCEANLLGLGRKTAEQRIAHLVLDLYHRLLRYSPGEPPPRSIPFPLTQEMLGELTGLTPVHTNRVLRKLRLDGVMLCERHRVEILDLPRLSRIGDYRAKGEG